jgi:SAM-dependent methyltransferase
METIQEQTDLIAIKGRQQQTWSSGDFDVIARTTPIKAEMLCEAVDLHAGQQVLDVATGSGNTAIAAARRWCEVTGIDYVPSLLARARERAAAEGLTITFKEGDAEAIPFPNASFDVVLSTFGTMFAPNQAQAADELLRVCRPEGKIGMANWVPDSFIGEYFRVTSGYVPPAAGLKSSFVWGTEEGLRNLLSDGITSVKVVRRSFVFRYRSVEHWLDVFRTYYGPTLKAFAALDAKGQEDLARDLLALAQRFNHSGDDTMAVPADYLEVVAIRK